MSIQCGDIDEQNWQFHVVITSLLSIVTVLGFTPPQSFSEGLRSIFMKHSHQIFLGKNTSVGNGDEFCKVTLSEGLGK